MASAVMLYSFGAREGEEAGVLETDLVEATLVPGLDRNTIVAALHDLREEELYLHYTSRRYRFEPKVNLSKLIRDEATKFEPDEVLRQVKAALERGLPDRRTIRIWPEDSDKIPDKVPAFTLAFLHPDWDEQKRPLRRFIEGPPGSGRTYRNALALVLPDTAQFDRARHSARITLAIESLRHRAGRLNLTAEQLDELNERLQRARGDLDATAVRAYDQVVVPMAAKDGSAPYRIETIGLRTLLTSGRTLEQRVREALEGWVFDEITVDKLIALSGLGAARPAIRCSQLVDSFFSFFEYTKLWTAEPIARAIAAGVEQGRFAYATGVRLDDGKVTLSDYRLLRLGGPLPVEEIDLGADAAILSLELARSLLSETASASPEATALQSAHEVTLGQRWATLHGSGHDDRTTGDDQAPGAGETPRRIPGPTEQVRDVTLRVRLDAGALFGLNRALSWLRERSDELEVAITVHASLKADGVRRHQLNIGVLEPLQEGGVADEDLHMELS